MIDQFMGLPAHTLGFKMSGKLHDEDYKKFVPLVDAEIAKDGKVNILAQFHDFKGWDTKALWDDIKFSATHCTKIKRIALVGDKVDVQTLRRRGPPKSKLVCDVLQRLVLVESVMNIGRVAARWRGCAVYA